MDTYTLEEAKVIIRAENIKEKQKRRVSLRQELKRRFFGIIVFILGVMSPFVEGKDPLTGEYDLVLFYVLVAVGLVMIINPKFHEKLNQEEK